MLSTISDYKPTNDQDVEIKEKTDNHQWSSFSVKEKTYIRAKLVSVETQISHSATLNSEDSHFQREQIDYSYLLTFQEGPELKTYLFCEKPSNLEQYYLYAIENNRMISCYHSEKEFKNNITKYDEYDYIISGEAFLDALLCVSGLFFICFFHTVPLLDPFMITLATSFLCSLALKYLIRKRLSNLAEVILKKLKLKDFD